MLTQEQLAHTEVNLNKHARAHTYLYTQRCTQETSEHSSQSRKHALTHHFETSASSRRPIVWFAFACSFLVRVIDICVTNARANSHTQADGSNKKKSTKRRFNRNLQKRMMVFLNATLMEKTLLILVVRKSCWALSEKKISKQIRN